MAFHSKKSSTDMKVTMTLASQQNEPHPEVSIFVAIDTSGSMSGAKINQVYLSLHEMISKAPGYVRFIIRKFDEEVNTLVSKKKKYLDMKRLKADLIKCGSCTALYDAWGQVITEIPYDVSKLEAAYILIFTDGCDNRSKKYNLDSAITLTNEKVGKKVRLIFIQAGSHRIVADAVESKCSKDFCTVLRVEDSVTGIDYGFTRARQMFKFEISLSDAGLAAQFGMMSMNLKKSSGGGGLPSLMAKAQEEHGMVGNITRRLNNNGGHQFPKESRFQPPPARSVGGDTFPGPFTNSTPRMFTPRVFESRNFRASSPRQPRPPGNSQPGLLGCAPGAALTQINGDGAHVFLGHPTEKPQPKTTNKNGGRGKGNVPKKPPGQHSIRVSQIPSTLQMNPTKSLKDIIQEFFSQWGGCVVSDVRMLDSYFTAKVTFKLETSKKYALQHGGAANFHGSILKIESDD